MNYQKKKVLNKNKQVPTTSTTNTRIDAFLKHSTPNVTGEHERSLMYMWPRIKVLKIATTLIVYNLPIPKQMRRILFYDYELSV